VDGGREGAAVPEGRLGLREPAAEGATLDGSTGAALLLVSLSSGASSLGKLGLLEAILDAAAEGGSDGAREPAAEGGREGARDAAVEAGSEGAMESGAPPFKEDKDGIESVTVAAFGEWCALAARAYSSVSSSSSASVSAAPSLLVGHWCSATEASSEGTGRIGTADCTSDDSIDDRIILPSEHSRTSCWVPFNGAWISPSVLLWEDVTAEETRVDVGWIVNGSRFIVPASTLKILELFFSAKHNCPLPLALLLTESNISWAEGVISDHAASGRWKKMRSPYCAMNAPFSTHLIPMAAAPCTGAWISIGSRAKSSCSRVRTEPVDRPISHRPVEEEEATEVAGGSRHDCVHCSVGFTFLGCSDGVSSYTRNDPSSSTQASSNLEDDEKVEDGADQHTCITGWSISISA
jgi:hypothetical protein